MKTTNKTLLILAIALAIVSLGSSQALAQFTTDAKVYQADNGKSEAILFVASVDSLSDYTSKAFYLDDYDAESFFSYPLSYGVILSSAGTPHVFLYIQGTIGDGNWFTVDTVAANDSIKTYATGTLDLNNKKCFAYRVYADGITGNRLDTQLTFSLFVYRKEYK